MLLWGRNTFGQCGNDPTSRKLSPPHLLCVDEWQGLRGIALGEHHTLAWTEHGDLRAWGRNREAQLGVDNVDHLISEPTPVCALHRHVVVDACAGAFHSLAVTRAGRMFWWGLVHASDTDGTSVETGDSDSATGTRDADQAQAEAVARANSHATARRGGGALPVSERVRNLVQESEWLYLSCGEGAGAFAEATPSATSTANVATADEAAAENVGAGDAAHEGNRTLLNARRRKVPTPSPCPFAVRAGCVPRISAVAAGFGHSLALDVSGCVWAAGYNDHGQLGTGNRLPNPRFAQVRIPLPGANGCAWHRARAVQVACGQQHSFARCSGVDTAGNDCCDDVVPSALFAWGSNVLGQLGLGSAGASVLSPCDVSALHGRHVLCVAAGANHSVALTVAPNQRSTDGSTTVFSWGHAEYGQHGDGDTHVANAGDGDGNGGGVGGGGGGGGGGDLGRGTQYYYVPRTLSLPLQPHDRVVHVCCGAHFTVATCASGRLLSWGWNGFGALGRDGFASSGARSVGDSLIVPSPPPAAASAAEGGGGSAGLCSGALANTTGGALKAAAGAGGSHCAALLAPALVAELGLGRDEGSGGAPGGGGGAHQGHYYALLCECQSREQVECWPPTTQELATAHARGTADRAADVRFLLLDAKPRSRARIHSVTDGACDAPAAAAHAHAHTCAFLAHSVVVCARSAYMRGLIAAARREQNPCACEIDPRTSWGTGPGPLCVDVPVWVDGASVDAFSALLAFLYCDDLRPGPLPATDTADDSAATPAENHRAPSARLQLSYGVLLSLHRLAASGGPMPLPRLAALCARRLAQLTRSSGTTERAIPPLPHSTFASDMLRVLRTSPAPAPDGSADLIFCCNQPMHGSDEDCSCTSVWASDAEGGVSGQTILALPAGGLRCHRALLCPLPSPAVTATHDVRAFFGALLRHSSLRPGDELNISTTLLPPGASTATASGADAKHDVEELAATSRAFVMLIEWLYSGECELHRKFVSVRHAMVASFNSDDVSDAMQLLALALRVGADPLAQWCEHTICCALYSMASTVAGLQPQSHMKPTAGAGYDAGVEIDDGDFKASVRACRAFAIQFGLERLSQLCDDV